MLHAFFEHIQHFTNGGGTEKACMEKQLPAAFKTNNFLTRIKMLYSSNKTLRHCNKSNRHLYTAIYADTYRHHNDYASIMSKYRLPYSLSFCHLLNNILKIVLYSNNFENFHSIWNFTTAAMNSQQKL